MARPKKQTVDYFPHFATSGKTMYILESRFGNDGYAFWFKLLELLATTDGHVIDASNPSEWEFLLAKTRVDEDLGREMLEMLAKLEAIDTELWESSIIWSENFVQNIADVYKKRRTSIPPKPSPKSISYPKLSDGAVSGTDNPNTTVVSVNENPQSKVKETIVKETKGKNSSKDPATPNAHQFYQDNFGMQNPTVMQTIEFWIEDLNEELVIEAMRRAAIDQKGFRYAEGIMKNWDKKNIKTMEQVKGEDVAFANKSQQKNNFRGAIKVEKEPEWLNQEPTTEEELLPEDVQAKFEERLKKFREGAKQDGD